MLRYLLCLLIALPLGCAASATPSAATVDPADYDARRVAVFDYLRPAGDYDGWNLWAWAEGQDGAAYPFEPVAGEDFHRAVVPLADGVDKLGFIVRLNEWEQKDVGSDRFLGLSGDVTRATLVAGDETVYADPSEIDTTMRIDAAFLDAPDAVTLVTTQPLIPSIAAGITVEGADYGVAGVDEINPLKYRVRLGREVAREDLARLSLAVPGLEAEPVYAREVLAADAYTALDAELGPRYSADKTTFRTWSPVSEAVDVLLYDAVGDDEPSEVVELRHVGRGVWEGVAAGDLHGRPYRVRFFNYGRARTVPDIHTFAAGPDSRYSVVVDLDRTDPDGWAGHAVPTLAGAGVGTDEIIYEVHVRDYSVHDEAIPTEIRGKYPGLTADGDGGLKYLTDLGVTAVHLLPIHDFLSDRHDYNWGYWTALFNVAEADYATDPADPTSAPRELKAAIRDLHAADIRVILDVVYNHTATGRGQEAYQAAAPFYYFRTTDAGELRNDAGTGNSFADERPMVRKHIADSLAFWAEEYQVDGFRFDLLGTHRPETVEHVVERLRGIRPDLTIYGEPWTGGGPIYFPKGQQRGVGIAVFNDHLRNAVRGDLDGTATGFATGPGGDSAAVVAGVRGAIDDFADDPAEVINYVSAHDNRTLWDKIEHTHPDLDGWTKAAMHKLALGVVLTSQGNAFLHAGSEFARTKGGEHNSYNKSDAVNAMDWVRRDENAAMVEWVAGLIELRRAQPAFRLATADEVREHLGVFRDEGGVIGFTLMGVEGGWQEIAVIYNGEPTEQAVTLPAGTWTQVVDATKAGTEPIAEVADEVTLPPYGMAVLHR